MAVVEDCEPQFSAMGSELARVIVEGEPRYQLVSCCPPDSGRDRHRWCNDLNHDKWFVPEHEVWFTERFLNRVRQDEHLPKGWSHVPEGEWSGEIVKYDDPNDGKRYAWKLTDEYGGPEESPGFWRQGVWA